MINNDRIVPVTKTDLLTLIGTTMLLAGTSVDKLAPTDVEGTFAMASGSGNKLCSQPLKSLNFGSGVTSAVIYFIPALDYEGFTKTGATLTVTGDVVADGATLYTATLSTNALTIAKKAL